MTPEEMKKRSAEKVAEIQALCKKLQVILVPKDLLTEQMTIEKIIFYQDMEMYPKLPPAVSPQSSGPAGIGSSESSVSTPK